MKRKIIAVDLFAGAGGTSTGLAQACEKLGIEVQLTAVNHWSVAIASHQKNHPWARHINSSIEKLDPFEVVPGKRVDLLVASPECRYHSTARGGRPVHDQKRASAWYILRWAELLYIKNILIENVPEFRKWGPLNSKGKRIKSLEGTTYQAFLQSLRSLGYHVEERILNAADYGDATTRKRLFIIARRHSKVVTWPQATHAPIQNGLKGWKPARDVIDWSIPGESIFGRKRPLAPKTIDRIAEGLKKFAGPYAEPFLAILRGTSKVRSIGKPIPSLTAGGGHVALCQPFLLSHRVFDQANVDSIDKPMRTITSTARDISMAQAFIIPNFGEKKGQKPRTHDLDKPLPAATSHGAGGLVEAFILPRKGYYQSTGNVPRSIDKPLPTATSRGGGFLVQPYIVGTGGPTGSGRPRSTKDPLKTVLTNNRAALIEPFIITPGGPNLPGGRSVKKPLATVMCKDRMAVVNPYLVKVNHAGKKRQAHDIGKPMPTLTAKNGFAVIAPMLVKYFGTGRAKPTSKPVDTLTTKDRMGLAVPLAKGDYAIDILFRMLNPSELARAMSFPEGYEFVGKKEDIVKQIGNAVSVGKARALCMAILKQEVRR
jgi:DNA (cytosine-5)-methyltransferase 1